MSDIKGVKDIKFEPNKRLFNRVRLFFVAFLAFVHINLGILTIN